MTSRAAAIAAGRASGDALGAVRRVRGDCSRVVGAAARREIVVAWIATPAAFGEDADAIQAAVSSVTGGSDDAN